MLVIWLLKREMAVYLYVQSMPTFNLVIAIFVCFYFNFASKSLSLHVDLENSCRACYSEEKSCPKRQIEVNFSLESKIVTKCAF